MKARTGPPHKTPLHLAAAGGHLKVGENQEDFSSVIDNLQA